MPEGDSFRTNSDLFSNHYLDDHLPETEDWTSVPDEEIEQAFEEIREEYEKKEGRLEGWNERRLQRRFINPVLDILGFSYAVEETVSRGQRTPDYGFFSDEAALADADQRGDAGEDFYANAVAVGDAKRWDRPLDTQGERRRDFENPSFQIHVYLQETPARWAILTNGRKWRLYHESTSHRIDSYYEVDLPAVLEADDLETFRYFYLFFQKAAFVEDGTGTSFLDNVYEESNIFAQDLGEDLQDNIYEAIKLLAEGFLEYPDNDLSRDDLDLIHDSALIYLYRIIFVLYAEAEGRDLLDTDNRTYKDEFSLNLLKQKVAKKLDKPEPGYLNSKDRLWSHLQDLFELIDQGSRAQGISEDKLHVPAYNGGLFRTDPDEMDSDEARFLAEHRVGDAYLARVIDLLTRSPNGADGGKTFVDYSSLDIRHLGSIYEGLLEYKLHVADEPLALEDGEYAPTDHGDAAVEPGEVYLTTGSGERKATGSYYTPEYIVEYIVENTLGPLVEEIRAELFEETGRDDPGFAEEFAERVFELKVLDPAMGSGHFLTNAVDFLARKIIDARERQGQQQGAESIDPSHDIYWARRQVAQRCIYGVDLNPLAVELAKVSLWLRTLAAEQPLAFLDHHLKTGNSLVGSDIEEVLAENGADGDGGQLTLRDSFDRTRQEAIEHVMKRFQDLLAIDNETLDDIKTMEDVYQEVREDELYQHLIAMANVHTAGAFGLYVPEDAYEEMARALRDDAWDEIKGRGWFEDAQALAEEKFFFHWELEFPVAFYSEDGSRMTDGGFDTVLGNPPYVRIYRGKLDEEDVEYWRSHFDAAHMKFDLYVLFLELSLDLTREGGMQSMIVPGKFTSSPYGEPLRKKILAETEIDSILDVRDVNVFEDVTVSTVVPVFHKTSKPQHGRFPIWSLGDEGVKLRHHTDSSTYEGNEDVIFPLEQDLQDIELVQKIEEGTFPFSRVFYANWGLRTGTDEKTEKYVVKEADDPKARPMIRGENVVDRYRLRPPEEYIIYERDDLYNPMFEELFENPKIVFRKISGRGLMAVADEDGYYCFSTLIPCVNIRHVTEVDRSGIPEMTPEAARYTDLYPFLAIVNSTLMRWYYSNTVSDKLSVVPNHIKNLPMADMDVEPEGGYSELVKDIESALTEEIVSDLDDILGQDLPDQDIYHLLSLLAQNVTQWNLEIETLNLDLGDYLGNYADGKELEDVWSPAHGVKDSILYETTEQRAGLRAGRAEVERTDGELELSLTARYKPSNTRNRSTDQWGYVETDPVPAIRIRDLPERERDLIEAFVPVAVEEGDGFAGFRENATKTISLLDRLKAIRLPKLDDVTGDLERYLEAKRRADELDEKIEKTDELIDEIVYELYGLDEEEIEIVEATVGGKG